MDEQHTVNSLRQTLRVGPLLRYELEQAACMQGMDATGLGRRILREWLEAHQRPVQEGRSDG